MPRLYIGGLSLKVSSENLQKHFSSYGQVSGIEIKEKKGVDGNVIARFSYLNLDAASDNVQNCINDLNGSTWKGEELKVDLAKESFLERLKREREKNQGKGEAQKKEFEQPYSPNFRTERNRDQEFNKKSGHEDHYAPKFRTDQHQEVTKEGNFEDSTLNYKFDTNFGEPKSKSKKKGKKSKKNYEDFSIVHAIKSDLPGCTDFVDPDDEGEEVVPKTIEHLNYLSTLSQIKTVRPIEQFEEESSYDFENKNETEGNDNYSMDYNNLKNDEGRSNNHSEVYEENQRSHKFEENKRWNDSNFDKEGSAFRQNEGNRSRDRSSNRDDIFHTIKRYDPTKEETNFYRKPASLKTEEPKVDDKKFVKISEELTFNKSSSFNFLSLFDNKDKNDNCVQSPEKFESNALTERNRSSNLEEPSEREGAMENKSAIEKQYIERRQKSRNFFVKSDDPMLKDALDWITTPITEEARKEFERVRPELIDIIKMRRKRAMEKAGHARRLVKNNRSGFQTRGRGRRFRDEGKLIDSESLAKRKKEE